MTIKKLIIATNLALIASVSQAATFVIEKVNEGHSIDGGNGSVNGRQAYLWPTNTNNVNQRWVQIDQGGGYYSYKKENTNVCWDGGNGGSRAQAITLETCDSSDNNQHWKKVKVFNGTEIYRIEKRNASGWSFDGNNGSSERQKIYLWNSNSSNVNQQWEFIRVDDENTSNPGVIENGNTPQGPGSSWTFCSNERDACNFSGIKQLAYGAGDDWSLSVEIGGVTCNNNHLKDSAPGKTKSCWFRNTTYDYLVVDSIDELKSAMSKNNQRIRMARGKYVADELLSDSTTVFKFDGNNNYLDMTGVTLQVPTKLLSSMDRNPIHSQVTYDIIGDNIRIVNGTFENIYPNGQNDVSDFGKHNDDSSSEYWPARQMSEFRIYGDNTQLLGNTITIRGSYPYGYGDMFGKGGGSVVYLRKHGGIQVHGDNTIIDGVNLTVLAFGHGIFMQGADNTKIRNTHVQGAVRLGNEMYNDGSNSLPAQWDFRQQSPAWYVGIPIVKDRMYNLTEDGIRAYGSGTKFDGSVVNTGSIYVENTTVVNMRNCFALVAAKSAELDNVEVRGCAENGYSLPSGGKVTKGRGDAAYAPLIQMPYGNESNIDLDITVLEPNHTTGEFFFTDIAGSGHKIILRSDGNKAVGSNPIAVGHAWDRWNYDSSNLSRHGARDIEIHNYTDHELLLTDYSSDITGSSEGNITDKGDDNDVDKR